MSDEDFDTKQRAALSAGRCSDCGRALIGGPRGGAAQNFYCTGREECRAGFNLTFFDGQLVFAQRIGEVDDERFKLYAGDGR